ncbi:MAG: hypothetical protein IAI50_15305 [Candidatus Eremiobacteraeota bacterium]|nr:hypothetical protein [Candidatus Eremiobacteraeota bacterium]
MNDRLRVTFTCAIAAAGVYVLGCPTGLGAATRRVAGPTLAVDATAMRHTISPDIYGVTIFWNTADSNYAAFRTFAQQIGLPANRYGGDGTTRYNWKVDASNPGSDFYFTAGNGETTPVASASVDTIVANNRSLKTKSIITVPIIGDINNAAAYHCSYPESVYPNQQAYNPYIHPNGDNCGNGVSASNGQYILDTDIPASDIPNKTNFQQSWVTHFTKKFGSAAAGGVGIYQLDNEPNGWIGVQHDVRPENIGYTELVSRSTQYATAIKTADPTALVLGPGDISPADENCNDGGQPGTCNNDNANNHGGTPLGLYYLQQFALQKTRLLDYYSMHYPGSCCFSVNGTLPDMVTAIQRHLGWIAQAYPGTKLAYDEWNRGTGNGFANALATADGLGVMGQQGVDLASFWGLGDPSYPSAFAFQMFRNYDAHGAEFGNVSVTASSTDPSSLTIYAARGAKGALTVLVVNETTSDLSSQLQIAHFKVTGPVLVYQYTQANLAAIVAEPSLAPSRSLAVTFPAQSLTMLVAP